MERFSNYTHCKNTKFTGGFCNNRRCSRARTTAHTGSNEYHVCAVQMIADRVDFLFGCGASHFRLRAGAKTSGHARAHLDDSLAFDMLSAWASVLATMKSTPCSPAAIML